jgi:hypothetical protein
MNGFLYIVTAPTASLKAVQTKPAPELDRLDLLTAGPPRNQFSVRLAHR